MNKRQEKAFKEKARKLADLALQKEEEKKLPMADMLLIQIAEEKGVSVERAREKLAREGVYL